VYLLIRLDRLENEGFGEQRTPLRRALPSRFHQPLVIGPESIRSVLCSTALRLWGTMKYAYQCRIGLLAFLIQLRYRANQRYFQV
jgi:hypothetical protein